MDLNAVCTAMSNAAATITLPAGSGALTCYPILPDSVVVPCFFLADITQQFDGAFQRGMDTVETTWRVLVGRSDDVSAQTLLRSLISGSGSYSLKTALESARHNSTGGKGLSGACDDYQVSRVQGYGWYEHDGIQYAGAELVITIVGSGV